MIRNISRKHRRRLRRRPNGAAAIGSVCLMDIFMDIYGYIINIYGYISYTFSYIPYIFPRYVPCIFPCVFLNLWSEE